MADTRDVAWHKCEAEVSAVFSALTKLKEAAEAAPQEDWRASLLWEAAQQVGENFQYCVWDAHLTPNKPENFRHWRERLTELERL